MHHSGLWEHDELSQSDFAPAGAIARHGYVVECQREMSQQEIRAAFGGGPTLDDDQVSG